MASSSHHSLDATFDQYFEEAYNNAFDNATDAQVPPTRERKKRQYIERDREQGQHRLWNDYFSDDATYTADLFRRRFRMNKILFMKIVDKLSNQVPYFQQRRNGSGRLGLTRLHKCTTTIRIMAYGSAGDMVDEYLRLSAGTALLCLEKFVEGVVLLFGDEYLRSHTPYEFERLLRVGEARGFTRMIGSIDCMHWEWKNCPTAWKGQYTCGSSKPTIVLEAVASHDLWIWHDFFGSPCILNDLNVLVQSQVFDDIIHGRAPKVNYFVNGREYHFAYYLTDGIYPKWATFIQSIPLPQDPKTQLFAIYQESVQKNVEWAFGVLHARFAIVKNPALFWDKDKIGNIMQTCIKLHNMIVEDERDGYGNSHLGEFSYGEGNENAHVDYSFSTDRPSNLQNVMAIRARVKDKAKHEQLKADLVENIWQKFERN